MKKSASIIATSSLLLFMNASLNAQADPVVSSPAIENKVAVLPIQYIGEGNTQRVEDMRYHLQNIAYLYLKGEAIELRFQSPAETNALLLKKGVNELNFREFTPKELAAILQVEYIMTGMITQVIKGESNFYTSTRSDHGYRDRNRREETGHSKTMQEFNTHIDLDIYNSKGEQLFSKSRRSILPFVDAYKNGIEYLLKDLCYIKDKTITSIK